MHQSIVFSISPVYEKIENELYVLKRISLSHLHFSDQMDLGTCTRYFQNREIVNRKTALESRIRYLEKELFEKRKELETY